MRIAPSARVLGPDRKLSKVRKFYVLSSFQSSFDDLERGLYDIGGVTIRNPVFLADSTNNLCLGHRLTASLWIVLKVGPSRKAPVGYVGREALRPRRTG
jgi:hypothetical protein